MTRRRCPVCWRLVAEIRWNRIAYHRDSISRDMCPASGEPYEITDTLLLTGGIAWPSSSPQ